MGEMSYGAWCDSLRVSAKFSSFFMRRDKNMRKAIREQSSTPKKLRKFSTEVLQAKKVWNYVLFQELFSILLTSFTFVENFNFQGIVHYI